MIWVFVFLVLGIALAVAEVFFVSLGVLAIAAGVCLLMAAATAFGVSPAWGWTVVAAEVVLVPLAVRLAFQVLPRLAFGRRMILEGPATAPGPGVPSYDHLVGRTGVALTDLRPSGTAELGDERLSVVSLSGMLARGTPLVVVSVEGTEVRVRPHSSNEPASEAPSRSPA